MSTELVNDVEYDLMKSQNEWSTTLLGDLVDGFRGVSYQPKHLLDGYADDSVILLRANNIQNGQLLFDNIQIIPNHLVKDNQLLNMGDIAVCMSNGSKILVGKAAQYDKEQGKFFTVGAFCSVFKPKKNSVIKFIRYLFSSQAYQKHIDISLAGSAINNLKNSDIENIVFAIPSKGLQKKIAIILSSIDNTIEKTEALIHKYQQIKAGLMQDLFTRGVTADGKLRPPREQAQELYKESPIGWIPKEWDLMKASNICYPITKGTTPSEFINSSDETGSIPYIRVENLNFNGSLQFDRDSLFVCKSIHDSELARSKVFAGDILMNIVGPPLGKISLITDEYKEWNTNQAVAIYRVLNPKYRYYLLYFLLSDFAQKWFYLRSKQTSGQVNLTLEMCSNLEIPFPKDKAEIISISNILTKVFERINTENNFRLKLFKQKSGLMHDLLTGKVQVKVDKEEPAHV